MAKAKMMAGGGMMSKMKEMAPSKMSKVKTSAKPDGVAKKGLTKGKMDRLMRMGTSTPLNETEPGYGCHP
jgi:hypothetical protein